MVTYVSVLIMLLSDPQIKVYHEQAAAIAYAYDIDVGIFRSLIFAESRWDAKASNGYCYGLTQMKPSTASEVAADKITGEMLTKDPILAMELGACYLKKLLDRAQGNMRKALTDYRYGPYSGKTVNNKYVDKVISIYQQCYNSSGVENPKFGETYDSSNSGRRDNWVRLQEWRYNRIWFGIVGYQR